MARLFLIDPENPEFPLLVGWVLRNADGSIKRAHVENGGWTLKVVEGVAGAYQDDWGEDPVAEWPAPKWEEVPVPESVGGHYNDAFAWLEGSSTGNHEVETSATTKRGVSHENQ